MEDDNGLELSLGLSFGGSSGKSNIKDTSSDTKLNEGGSNRLMGGPTTAADPPFKNFFPSVNESQDQTGGQRTAPEPQTFWSDLRKCSTVMRDTSSSAQKNSIQFNQYEEFRPSNSKAAESEEVKSNKRKMPFDDINSQNKHEKLVEYTDLHGKNPTSINLIRTHASGVAEDACSGVNEDAADSEAEGSNSCKSLDIPKIGDRYAYIEDLHCQKESSVSRSESNQKLGKAAHGVPLFQSLTSTTVLYPVPADAATNADDSTVTGFTTAVQSIPVSSAAPTAGQKLNTSNFQLSFGYSPVQLPTLETGSSWAFNSPVTRHITSTVSRDVGSNMENPDGLKASHVPVQDPPSLSSSKPHDVKGTNHVEIGSSSQNSDQSKATSPFFNVDSRPSRSTAEGISHDASSTIRPGIAPDVKFGGSGSYPDLPWVSTTGPSGRTISGVTYKYNQNEIRIVCACHGTHMTPEKFVQHASADTLS